MCAATWRRLSGYSILRFGRGHPGMQHVDSTETRSATRRTRRREQKATISQHNYTPQQETKYSLNTGQIDDISRATEK